MTLAFWDSSALLKLLVEEQGTNLAAALWDESTGAVASRLIVPEVSAALAEALRAGRIDGARAQVARREWRRYLAALDVVELTAQIADRAAILAAAHPLSGADAVQLATAVVLEGSDFVVVTWDRRLAAAASAEGLNVVPAAA